MECPHQAGPMRPMVDASYLAARINLLTGPFVNLVRKREFVRKLLVYQQTKWVNPERIAA
jgi:hypothetical protein